MLHLHQIHQTLGRCEIHIRIKEFFSLIEKTSNDIIGGNGNGFLLQICLIENYNAHSFIMYIEPTPFTFL